MFLAVAIIAVGIGVWYFNRDDDSAPQYMTASVTRGDLTQAVTATGTLNPVTNVTVGSQISGIIQKLYADWNSPVKANQVVAQLDPATYQGAVHQAEGDLANAKANLELAQVQAQRAEELFKDQLISDSDYDTAIATLHQAQAHGSNQGGVAGQRESQSGALHDLLAGGRHRHLPQRGHRPDRRRQLVRADAVPSPTT